MFLAINCNSWKTKGLLDSQTEFIEPITSNGIQLPAVQIYCDMEMENGVGVTVIGMSPTQNCDRYSPTSSKELSFGFNFLDHWILDKRDDFRLKLLIFLF